jgi:hypothetical protein
MPYTNAIFYLDFTVTGGTSGDGARSTLSNVVFSQSGADDVLGTYVSHGLITGAVIDVTGCGAAYANSAWKVTWVDADTFTVDGASWASWNDADVTGNAVPRGGQSWADAWATITLGATAARIAAGDIIRIAKSPVPVNMGQSAQWTTTTVTGGGFPATVAITGTANNGAGLIRITTTAVHGLVTGNVTQILAVTGTVEANGAWLVTRIDDYNFDLVGSVFASAWISGGTTQNITSKAVILDTAVNATVDNCSTTYTAVTGLITVLNATPTAGGSGYTLNDILTITTGGTGATCQVTGVNVGVVTAVTLLTGGNGGYTTGATKATTGGTGTLCTVNITTVANATVTNTAYTTDAKEGAACMKIVAPTTCQAGSKLAYLAIAPGTLASCQKLSFWIKNSAAITAGQWKICLCSDAIGEVIVDSFLIPAIPATNARWLPLTLTKAGGGNLGASTASIAVYADTVAPATSSNIIIDNVIACTASGLNLQSLISKNASAQGGTEGFYGIQSIKGRIILLDNDTNTKCNAGRGYSGVTESVATYFRETVKTTIDAGGFGDVNTINSSGTLGNNIQYQGGYDTSTTAQNGETFLDGLNCNGTGVSVSSKSFITINYLSASRYYSGVILSGASSITITKVTNLINNANYGIASSGACAGSIIGEITNASNNTNYGIYFAAGFVLGSISTIVNVSNNLSYGYVNGGSCNTVLMISNACNNLYAGVGIDGNNNTAVTVSSTNNAGSGVSMAGYNSCIDSVTANNNTGYGVYLSGNNNLIDELTTTGNSLAGVYSAMGINYVGSATISEGTLAGFAGTINTTGAICIAKYGGTAGRWYRAHKYGIASDQITGGQNAAWASGGSGLCQYLNPTSTTYYLPEVFYIPCTASTAVSCHFSVKKTSAAADCTLTFSAMGSGITAINAASVSLTDDWVQYESAAMTPTEDGFIRIELRAIDGGTTGDIGIDDIHSI